MTATGVTTSEPGGSIPLCDASDPVPRRSSVESRWLRFRHLLMEADHLSHVNRYLPWRYPLGGLGMAAVAALLCGWFIHVQAFILLIGIASVIGLGLVWPWLSLWGIRGTLSFAEPRGVEGRAVTAKLVVKNFFPVGAWGLRLHGGSRGWQGRQSIVSLAAIPGWRTTEFVITFIPPARGEYPCGEAWLGTGFPFGLWEARRPIETIGRLLAWPATFDPGAVPEAAASDRTREGLTFRDRVGHAGDFMGVRPYVRGESLRRIHWPQTAKCGDLIICERQASANISVQIVVDCNPEVHGGSGSRGSREWAIRTAASIAASFLARGALIELLADRVVVPLGSGESQRRRILDALARVPDDAPASLAEQLASSPARRFRSGLQAVISTDLGASNVPAAEFRRPSTHLILFRASAFGSTGRSKAVEGPSATQPRAWLEINDANDVPGAFRRAWREVLYAN